MAYLQYRLDNDPDGIEAEDIRAALNLFWLDRAAQAPTHQALGDHLKAEEEYLDGCRVASDEKILGAKEGW